jgi:integrase
MPRKAKPFQHQGYFYTTAGGRWRKLCPLGAGYAEAVRLLELPELPGGETLGVVIKQYAAHCQSYYVLPGGRVSSEPRSIALALSYLQRAAGDLPIAQLSKEHLKQARGLMVESCSRKTANQHAGRIKRFAAWAADRGLLPDAAAAGIRSLANLPAFRSGAAEHEPITAVGAESVAAVIAVIAEPWRSLVRLQWFSGLRPGEACGIAVEQLVPDGDGFRLDLGLQHKGGWRGRRKVVLLGSQAGFVLRPWLYAAAVNRRPEVFVTTWTAGGGVPRPAVPSSYAHAVKRCCEAAGVPHFHPNQLRHSYATRARAAFGLEAAQHALGHTRANTTEIYAERDQSLAARVVQRLG